MKATLSPATSSVLSASTLPATLSLWTSRKWIEHKKDYILINNREIIYQ